MTVEITPFGVPLAEIAADCRAMPLAAFVDRYGRAFVVRFTSTGTRPRPPTPTLVVDDGGAETGDTAMYVMPVVKRRASALPYISIGRLDGNDIAIADDSVSRFHAIVREVGEGYTILDAKSRNGTLVDGKKVPRREMGEAVPLVSGVALRFGVVHASFLNAAELMQLARGMFPAT